MPVPVRAARAVLGGKSGVVRRFGLGNVFLLWRGLGSGDVSILATLKFRRCFYSADAFDFGDVLS